MHNNLTNLPEAISLRYPAISLEDLYHLYDAAEMKEEALERIRRIRVEEYADRSRRLLGIACRLGGIEW
jgi:hypothetical protein